MTRKTGIGCRLWGILLPDLSLRASHFTYLHDRLARGHLRAFVQLEFRVVAAGSPLIEEVATAVVVQRHLGVVAKVVDAEGPLLRRAVHERLVLAARAARVKLVALLKRGKLYLRHEYER